MKSQVREHSRLCGMFEVSLSYTVKPCIHIQTIIELKNEETIDNLKYEVYKYIYVCIIYILFILYIIKYKDIS